MTSTPDELHDGEKKSVGVGPYEGAWPDDTRLDPELLAEGDARNVLDEFRYWRRDAVVAELDTRRHPLQIAIENLGHDFNIGSIVRTSNAFNVSQVHIVGRRRWNRRGAMVTDRYMHVDHHPTVDDFLACVRSDSEPEVAIIGIDNIPGSTPIELSELPRNCVLVFGEESNGLSPEMAAACQQVLHITQYGSTRSMNVGHAAAIAMYEWMRQHSVPEQ